MLIHLNLCNNEYKIFRRYKEKHRVIIIPITAVGKVWQEKANRESQMKDNIDVWHAQMIFHPKIQNPFTHTNDAAPPGPALGTAGKVAEVDLVTPGLLLLYSCPLECCSPGSACHRALAIDS